MFDAKQCGKLCKSCSAICTNDAQKFAKIFFSREIKQSLRKKIDIPRKPYLTQTKYHGLFIVQETLYKPLSTFMYVYSECWARFDFYCRFVSFLFRYEKKIFVLLRLIFEKILLKTTSTISFSNQNDEPETRRLVFCFEKTKTKRQNVVFSIVFNNAAQLYLQY